jgi:hypothetical protein
MTPERAAAEEQCAREYAEGIKRGDLDWAAKNMEIIDRWSVTALLRIKRRAWLIVYERPSS